MPIQQMFLGLGAGSKSGLGYGSVFFDGSGDDLEVSQSGKEFSFVTSQSHFVIECFVKSTDISSSALYKRIWSLIDDTSNPLNKGLCLSWEYNDNRFKVRIDDAITLQSSPVTPSDDWHHVVVLRIFDYIQMYVDGAWQGQTQWNEVFNGSVSTFKIGEHHAINGSTFPGRISNVRFIQNQRIYTSQPITVPSAPLEVWRGSSQYVDFGDADGLIGAADSNLNIGTSPFTFECWVYLDATPGTGSPNYARVFQLDGPTGNSNYNNLQVTINPSNQTLHAWAYGGGNPVAIVGNVSLLGQWHHIAVVRDTNNVITQYVDGIADGNVSNSTDFSPNSGSPRPRIGSYDAGGTNGVFNGKISNVRLLVGTPLYTGPFGIPEWPLTNITNTKLLCCQSDTSATAAPVGPTLSANNSPTVGTASGGFNTVVLACQDPDDATTEACGKTITVGDNAIHDSDHPF